MISTLDSKLLKRILWLIMVSHFAWAVAISEKMSDWVLRKPAFYKLLFVLMISFFNAFELNLRSHSHLTFFRVTWLGKKPVRVEFGLIVTANRVCLLRRTHSLLLLHALSIVIILFYLLDIIPLSFLVLHRVYHHCSFITIVWVAHHRVSAYLPLLQVHPFHSVVRVTANI